MGTLLTSTNSGARAVRWRLAMFGALLIASAVGAGLLAALHLRATPSTADVPIREAVVVPAPVAAAGVPATAPATDQPRASYDTTRAIATHFGRLRSASKAYRAMYDHYATSREELSRMVTSTDQYRASYDYTWTGRDR